MCDRDFCRATYISKKILGWTLALRSAIFFAVFEGFSLISGVLAAFSARLLRNCSR